MPCRNYLLAGAVFVCLFVTNVIIGLQFLNSSNANENGVILSHTINPKLFDDDLNWGGSLSPNSSGEKIYDLFLPCEERSCASHLLEMPISLLIELLRTERLRLVYVVADDTGLTRAAVTKVIRSLKAFPSFESLLVNSVRVMVLPGVEEERPPINKEFRMLERFRDQSNEDELFTKLDLDTMLVPKRIVLTLDGIDTASDKVYAGRPNSSCDCGSTGLLSSSKCTYDRAIHYCSGFFYVTSRKTLLAIDKSAFRGAPKNNHQESCKSSDMSVGYMMNHGHTSKTALSCNSVTPNDNSGPGKSYPVDIKNDERTAVNSFVCQQNGSPGGIFDVHTVLLPLKTWSKVFYDKCVVFHPAKRQYDWLYLWNMVREGTDVVTSIDVPELSLPLPKCRIAAYVLSSPHRVEERQAVRLTWGAAARAYGIEIKFAVGRRKGFDLRWLESSLDYEQKSFGDVARIDLDESYSSLPQKNALGMRHFVRDNTSNCEYYFKTDADTYIRPYQLLKMLEVAETKARYSEFSSKSLEDVHLYIGKVWAQSKVVTDPTNQFYLGNDKVVKNLLNKGGHYPAYASGAAYLLSRSLVRDMQDCYSIENLLSGPEDVQIGICVDRLRSKYEVDIIDAVQFQQDKCDEETISDNPVSSHGDYNLYQRHEAHLRGQNFWCGLRKSYPGLIFGSKYQPGSDNFATNDVTDNAETNFIKRVVPPWQSVSDANLPWKYYFTSSSDLQNVPEWIVPFQKFCTDPDVLHFNCGVSVLKCTNCLHSWYTLSKFRGFNTTTVSIKTDFSEILGASIVLNGISGSSYFGHGFTNSLAAAKEVWKLDFVFRYYIDEDFDCSKLELELVELVSKWNFFPTLSSPTLIPNFDFRFVIGIYTSTSSLFEKIMECKEVLSINISGMLQKIDVDVDIAHADENSKKMIKNVFNLCREDAIAVLIPLMSHKSNVQLGFDETSVRNVLGQFQTLVSKGYSLLVTARITVIYVSDALRVILKDKYAIEEGRFKLLQSSGLQVCEVIETDVIS